MSKCMVSLKDVSNKSKYKNYLNTPFKKLFGSLSVKPMLPFTKSEFFIESPKVVKGMSISGVQQKLSLKKDKSNNLVITSTNGEYILKPSPQTFPHAAENEHCAMKTSELFDIETAKCGLIPFADGELAYITKRFDRTPSGKIHQEDLVQGFNLPSENKYNGSYEKSGQLIYKMCGGKLSVIFDYFKRVIHAYIIGNDDMHLKNISLMRKPENVSLSYDSLTPNYDSLFCSSFENKNPLEKALALDLLVEEEDGNFSSAFEKYGFYTGSDFKMLGNRIGLNDKVIANLFKTVKSKELKIIDLISASYMPDDMKSRTTNIVKQRIKSLMITDTTSEK